MTNETKLVAQKREVAGTSASRRLRREGWLPGVLGDKKGKSVSIQVNGHDFGLLLQHHRSENLILDLEIGKEKPKKVLLSEVQHDPITDKALHVDFIEISMTEKMRIDVPIELVGEAVGVVQEGGVLDYLLRELEVECLPVDLVQSIEADVSGLKIGDILLVSSLEVDPKLTVLTDSGTPVAGVSPPHVEEEVVPEEVAEGEEAAEPEVIGEEKKEEEGKEEAESAKAPESAGGEKKGKGKE